MTQGAAALDIIPVAEGAESAEAAPESAVATLAARFKQTLGDKVNMVRASARLTQSPVCLVAAGSWARTGNSRRSCPPTTRSRPAPAPVLEINPTHPLIKALSAKAAAGDASEAIDDAAVLLFGEARILDGEPPEDPADFSARIARLIERGFG